MKHTRVLILLTTGGLVILFALLTLGAQLTTLTADETTYVALGYGFLARGRTVFPVLTNRGYPPLLIALEALPLYLTNPHIPLEKLAGWPVDYESFSRSFQPYFLALPQMKLLARMPIIFLTILVGAVIFRWGRALWGPTAGLLALGILIFDPLLLGHGRLANSDAGAMALGTIALYAAWRWRQKPAWRWSLAAGLLLGLTLLAKVSGALWGATAGLMFMATLVEQRRSKDRRRLLGQSLLAGGLSLLAIWAAYGFEWGPVRNFPWPVPVPTYWESILYLVHYNDNYFALGLPQPAGWWYFPVAFLIKNPLPLLIGLAISLVALRRRMVSWTGFLTLGFFPLLYTCAAFVEDLNIGYRLMLPVHSFIYLVIGGGVAAWVQGKPFAMARRWGMGILGVWYVAMTLSVFPYEISFFNELVGGPDGGYRYLADSNVDWGQARDVVQAYVQAHPEAQTKPPVAKYQPPPGRYVVSASYLQGVGIGDPDVYAWFRQREPQAIIAHSYLVYDVPPVELGWLAQCDKPVAPLDAAAIAHGTGQANLREVSFDCTQAWLYPAGGAANGLYALHHALFEAPRLCLPSFLACPPSPMDTFIARHLASAHFSYAQTCDSDVEALKIYAAPTAAVPWPSTLKVYATDEATLPNALYPEALKPPVRLDGPLAFLGVTAYWDKASDGASLEVETWWQVVVSPSGQPFSIMGYLASADRTPLGSADGLGVSLSSLAVGDVVVQRHRFTKLPAQTRLIFLTGAYWLDTMERWSLGTTPSANLLLTNLESPR